MSILFNQQNKLHIFTFIKVFDLKKILVMFIIKVSILIEHVKQIDPFIMMDRLIIKVQIHILYDAQQVTKFFYNQKTLLVVFVLMIMNQWDQMKVVHMRIYRDRIDKDHPVRNIF